jgi:hypothetical protein
MPSANTLTVDLPRFSGEAFGSFGGQFFELNRACEVEGGMAPDGIVEPVDVAANGPVGFLAGVEDGPPDELGFQRLEERLHHRVVIAIPLAGHRDQDAMLLELGLVIDRAMSSSSSSLIGELSTFPKKVQTSAGSLRCLVSNNLRVLPARFNAARQNIMLMCDPGRGIVNRRSILALTHF